jgi:hypothetical protein
MRSAVLAAALGMAGRAAGAQAVGEVDALVRHGVELRQRGDDAGALAEFQRAHSRSEEPRVLAQLALAEQAMGRWLDADRHLRAALRSDADPWIARNRAALHQSEEQLGAHLGRLRVSGSVEGAEVFANDERVATLPMAEPARVVVGTNVIEVRAPGYVTMTRRVQVEPGQESRETFAFVREAPPLAPVSALRLSPMVAPRAEPEVARSGGAQRAFAWASLVTGAAGVGVGVFALMRRDGLVSQYDQRRDPVCPGTSSATQPTVCASNLDDIAAMQALAIGGFVGGGALALASVVLFATLPSTGESPRGLASVRCGGGPGQVGVSCGGVF